MPLDLFSLTQTRSSFELGSAVKKERSLAPPWCSYGAPMFAYRRGDDDNSRVFGITQGNCNHWDCPRCGPLLAKKNYGKIVEGTRVLMRDNKMYFITLTCRGREMSKSVAEKGYQRWTNRLLTAMRARTRRSGGVWAYVQVTERQRRGHPHSHLLTTYAPHDLIEGTQKKWRRDNEGRLVAHYDVALRSEWFKARCLSAGLGPEYDISEVADAEACSRYVAKYLFKDTLLTKWPKRWRRVRYSRSWPKLKKLETNARVLLTVEDWYYLSEDAAAVTLPADDPQVVARALDGLYGHDVLVQIKGASVQSGQARAGGLAEWLQYWRSL